MKRREFIGLLGSAAAWPLAARAQQTQGRPLISVLSPLPAAMAARNMEALRQGLRDLGYVEGRNVGFEFRYAEGDLSRLPALAAELAALQPAVIIAGSAPGAVAARDATRAIPIVMASVQDPMALGLAVSMARPGGNVTGFWSEGDESLIGKRLELLKDAVPGTSRLGVFVDPRDASDVSTLKALPAAASGLGLELRVIEGAPPTSSKPHSQRPHVKARRRFTSVKIRFSLPVARKSPQWRCGRGCPPSMGTGSSPLPAA
jgi:putative tryptophan/tyrosine transport system substrate-binding protein